jgi:hydroxyacylglutathione hydrolase
LHTPGHTPEHISLLLTDTVAADRPMGIFTGDFVFVGDVGRPDLLEKAAGFVDTAEIGARQMFQSLQRFRQLPDYLQVWPGHGAGSACGKDLGAVPTSTVGYEKLFNWALNVADEEVFVQKLLADQPEPPRYFALMKRVNKEGPAVLHGLKLPEELPFDSLVSLLEDDRPLVDTRSPVLFAQGHIPGTLNIPLESSFTTWSGWLLDYHQPYYLIADRQNLPEIIRHLSSIGLDNCAGFFDSMIVLSWLAADFYPATYQVLQPEQVAAKLSENESILIDVRNKSEWDEAHIPGAEHIMLGYLAEQASGIPKDKTIILQCRSGMRSAIAASILQAQGFESVSNMEGGIQAWQESGLPTTTDPSHVEPVVE